MVSKALRVNIKGSKVVAETIKESQEWKNCLTMYLNEPILLRFQGDVGVVDVSQKVPACEDP